MAGGDALYSTSVKPLGDEMKTSLIQKLSVSALVLALGSQTFAAVPPQRLVLPSETRAILKDIAEAGRAQDLTRLVTPEVTKVILDYSKLDDKDFRDIHSPVAATPAALGGAAAAGATAAVVEHLWDKYVGNEKTVVERYTDDSFDVASAVTTGESGFMQVRGTNGVEKLVWNHAPVEVGGADNRTNRSAAIIGSVSAANVSMIQPTTTDIIRIHQRNVRRLVPSGTEAHTLVVAEAAVGALAYKAAEWALDKYGNRPSIDIPTIGDRDFDLGVIRR